MAATDIVVAFTESDRDFAQFLYENLKKNKLSVTIMDRASQGSSKEQGGQAVVDCKVFLLVLSEEAVQRDLKSVRDMLALAYIANKSIIPIARQYFPKISKHLGSGMKLMLAKINWTFFVKDECRNENMEDLVKVIHQELIDISCAQQSQSAADDEPLEECDVYEALNSHAPDVARHDADGLENVTKAARQETHLSHDFWERHFPRQHEVTWVELKDAFLGDYDQKIAESYGEDKSKWFVHLLYKDVFDLQKVISREMYRTFAGRNRDANPNHFYERVKDYAIGQLAMKEVFDMESTVRLAAIQNLASFQTPGVITILFDFVEDPNPNIRAVAALALAKTGKRTKRIADKLIKMLSDEDRVVRESACLSLAHMKCARAVPGIIHLWRNDAIKHVREAAELAISRIGGEEAQMAIKVTHVLSQEMSNLRSAEKH